MKPIAMLSLLLLCVIFPVTYATPHRLPAKNHHTPSSWFDSIHSSGHLMISIMPPKSGSHDSFGIQQGRLAYVTTQVRQHTLYLHQIGYSARPIRVNIYMSQLNRLSLYGHTTLTAKNIRSNGLRLNADTTGRITLSGMMTLDQISALGHSKINIGWVRGNDMAIYGHGSSRITIAGNIGFIRVKLYDHSFLNARYLRAQQMWIKTNNFSQAQVLSSQALQAYPSDSSNIYYYKTPTLLNPINSDSGNTLQLGW